MKTLRALYFARRNLLRVLPLMRDARVPIALRATAIALALFIVSPLNILGDIPLIGFFDDAALLVLLASWFVSRAGVYTVNEPRPVRSTHAVVASSELTMARVAGDLFSV